MNFAWSSIPEFKRKFSKRSTQVFDDFINHENDQKISLSFKITKPGLNNDFLIKNLNAAIAWNDEWKKISKIPGVNVEFKERGYRSFTTFSLAHEITFDSVKSYFSFIGLTNDFEHKCQRVETLRNLNPIIWVLAINHRRIFDLSDTEWGMLLSFCRKFSENPNAFYNRPIRLVMVKGMDTKFIERNTHLLSKFFDIIGRKQAEGEIRFIEKYGFLRDSDIYFDIKDINNLYSPFKDIKVSLGSLLETDVRFKKVLIFENRENYKKHPGLEDGIVMFAWGNAVNVLDRSKCLKDSEITYCGDLDQAGFKILNSFRSTGLNISSFQMSMREVENFRKYCVPDKSPRLLNFDFLTDEEIKTVKYLFEYNLRLEQERLLVTKE